MADSSTILAMVGGAALLKPTGEVIAQKLAHATEAGIDNTARMFKRALARSPEGDQRPINTRVLSHVLDEAQTTDDEVMAEYLGGVLASSRSDDGGDDRGVALTATIATLSRHALRAHYVLYAHAARTMRGSDLNPDRYSELESAPLFLPLTQLFQSVGWSFSEMRYFSHSAHALGRAGLIQENFASGGPEALKRSVPYAPEVGLKYGVTPRGIELFMWGLGLGASELTGFFSLDSQRYSIADLPLVGRAVLVADMPPIDTAPE